MAKSKKIPVSELATDELIEKVKELKLQLQKARFAHAVSALEKPATLKSMRKEIARLLTELNKRNKEEALKAKN
jgi:large subunit ribosomal protein L29